MATDSDRFGPLHDPAVRSQRLGTHEIFIEGYIVFQRAHGTTTLADTKEMFEHCDAVYERYGYVLVLIDSSQGGMATPEARKYQSSVLRQRRYPSHSAIFGSTLLGRAGVILMTRATELLTGSKLFVDLVADEATARKILSEARERFVAQGIAKQR